MVLLMAMGGGGTTLLVQEQFWWFVCSSSGAFLYGCEIKSGQALEAWLAGCVLKKQRPKELRL